MTTPGGPAAGSIQDVPQRPGFGRLAVGLVGVAVIVLGAVLTVLGAPSLRELVSVAAWLLVPALLSDLVLMPAAAVLSAVVTRHLPSLWRAPVAVGLALTTFVALIGWPFITGFGRRPDNPSLLNRDYLGGTLVLLAVVWVGCGVAVLISSVRAGRRRSALA